MSMHTSTASPTTLHTPFKLFSHGAATLTCQARHRQGDEVVNRTKSSKNQLGHNQKFKSELVLLMTLGETIYQPEISRMVLTNRHKSNSVLLSGHSAVKSIYWPVDKATVKGKFICTTTTINYPAHHTTAHLAGSTFVNIKFNILDL